MKFVSKILLSVTFIWTSFAGVSQVSLVPANHAVYEWLHHQRVMGHVSEFEYESIPISRGRIEKYLNVIKDQKLDQLSKIDKGLLRSYLREFSLQNLKDQSNRTLFQGKKDNIVNTLVDKASLFLGQDEFHLYSHIDSVSNANLDIWWGQGFINSSSGSNSIKGGYNYLGLRTYGSLHKKIGYHLDYQNISSLSGNKNLESHPIWSETWNIKRGQTSTFYAQAFASVNFGKVSFDIGRGMINYGVGKNPLIASREAPDFDWIRLSWKSKYINYDFIHGSLQSFGTNPSNISLNGQNFAGRLRINRWLVMRRLTIKPSKWLQLAYSQTTIYSDRGIDLSHLNPVLPAEVAELNNQDLDNPSLYFDVVIRPYKYIEIFGSASADDINKKSDIFKKTGNRSSQDGVFAFNIGANFSYKTGTDLSIQYSQLDPFYYTHWIRFNTYEVFGRSIGAQIAPNSDELQVSLRQWLPRRSWIMATVKSKRQGFNSIQLDSEGHPISDVGGDLFEPQNGSEKVLFLAGDINKWKEVSIDCHIEPSRTIRINFAYNKIISTQGLRVPETDYLEVGLNLGY